MYVCEATNFIGSARVIIQLVVLTIPQFTVKPPKNHVVNTGDILTVNCSAKGDGTLFVAWSREYAKLPDQRATVRKDGTLVITQVVPRDAGKYVCTASSVGGAIKITADMNLAVVHSEWDMQVLIYNQLTFSVEIVDCTLSFSKEYRIFSLSRENYT